MAKKASRKTTDSLKTVETLRHSDSKRTNIPTAEQQSVMETEEKYSIRVAYERRNRDLDPQLVWRGKDEQDAQPLVVNAPPLYIQEKVHPKVLIDDLMRRTDNLKEKGKEQQLDLFGDFNGLPEEARSAEFYQHEANWTNRMILGDSLQVMASLAEREGLRGKVQCIYFDPPYGIKFNSNFQWSTNTRDVKDGSPEHITREPEQVKAFRDTWRDGIHSYLDYLRDRLTLAQDLLTLSGSVFVQIGDENVHRVRALMDEIFGEENFVSQINFKSMGALGQGDIPNVYDYLVWYARSKTSMKFRSVFRIQSFETDNEYKFLSDPSERLGYRLFYEGEPFPKNNERVFRRSTLTSSGYTPSCTFPFSFQGEDFTPFGHKSWRTNFDGMNRLKAAGRLFTLGKNLYFRRFATDSQLIQYENSWTDPPAAAGKIYVVQTAPKFIERCILMCTDPGDLVLDPTCGSGTTAVVAEEFGRRWITVDTSRVALALARSRIAGTKYPYYYLFDTEEGQQKQEELFGVPAATTKPAGQVKQGFIYQRSPRITLGDIANNIEVDVIHKSFQAKLDPVREQLNAALNQSWQEWEIPREAGERWDADASAAHAEVMALRRECAATMEILQSLDLESQEDRLREMIERRAKKFLEIINKSTGQKFTFDSLPDEPRDPWPDEAKKLHAKWWKLRIERQKEIDASIAAKADFEYLYDKPYEDKTKVRVAGPFTVESLSPHRTLAVGADDELIDPLDHNPMRQRGTSATDREIADFATMVLDNLKRSGVQQAHKEDKIEFTSLVPWPGDYIAAEGRYQDASGKEQRAGIFIGPEFGTISQPDLKAAARECGDAGFDVLISCGFNYEAHATGLLKLGRVQILKARMNADLHMSSDLKNTGKGNLFVIFGEPDITVRQSNAKGSKLGDIEVQINGVDVFQPSTGEVRSDGADGIACWFIDTDYNEESFFVRHAYFLGANDPYQSLKTALKAEIDKEAWDSLNSDTSRPFPPPKSGRIAVKVINHLGDEVMKVFRVKEVLE